MKLIQKIRQLLGIEQIEIAQSSNQKALLEMAAAIKNLAAATAATAQVPAAPSPGDEKLRAALEDAELRAAANQEDALKSFFKRYEEEIDDASKRGRGRPKLNSKKINLALDYDLAMVFSQMKNNVKFNVNDYINRAVRRAAEEDFTELLNALYQQNILAENSKNQRNN